MMERAAVERWLAESLRCRREKDAEGVVALFTADATYRSSPFREPNVGTEGIRSY